MKKLFLSLFCVSFFSLNHLNAEGGSGSYSTAIVTGNRAGAELDEKTLVLEDLLTARVADLGLQVISPEMVVGSYGSAASELEAKLSDQSSGLRIAQGLGADYILSAFITSFSERKKNVSAYGVQLENLIYTLRVSYKIVDANNGGALTAGVAKAEFTEQNTQSSSSGKVQASEVREEGGAPLAPAMTNSFSMSGGQTADDGLVQAVRRYESAVGLVVTSNQGQPNGMATAWAIAPDTFATNAHVSEPIREVLAKGGSAYIALNKNPEKKFRIIEAITHPKYQKVGANFEGRRPAVPTYDVGILKIDGETDVWFPLADAQTLAQLDSGYRIGYLGFPMEGLVGGGVDPRNPVATMQSGIITSNTDWWQGKAEYPERLLIQHNLGATGGASGSPIFNPNGEVVALLNAGNVVLSVQVGADGQPYVKRSPSAALVNFGQRVDILGDIYAEAATSQALYSNSAGGSNGTSAVMASRPTQPVAYLEPNVSDIVDSLLDDVTEQIGAQLRTKLAKKPLSEPSDAADYVSIEIDVETADLYVPDVRLGPENTVTIKDGKLAASPLQVTVEVDGVAVGMAPGKVEVKPGFSQLRLSRSGYKDWERTINARDGQKLSVAMEMSEAGLQRWAELTVFFNSLVDGAKLTDAQVKEIEARAKMLSQSGYKIDIKVDTDQAPTLQTQKSIFGSLFDVEQ